MGYRVVRADLEKDKNRIIGFWNSHHKKKMQEKYEHFYLANPAGKAKVWLLNKGEREDILGIAALFPRKLFINGYRYTAGIAGDAFVSPEHRSLGPALMLQKNVIATADNEEVDLIYLFPNHKAEAVVKRVGYQLLSNMHRRVKVLNVEPYLTRNGFPEIISRLIGPVLNNFSSIFPCEILPRLNRNITCKKITKVDGRFDELWHQNQQKRPIVGERSAGYLQWRFAPEKSGIVYAAFDKKDKKLLGYVACTHKDSFLSIRDMILPGRQEDANCLLTSLVRSVRRQNFQNINVLMPMSETIDTFFNKLGFHKRRTDRKIFLYVPKIKGVDVSVLSDHKNWLLMSGDDDT
jgi:hypothetical protein